MLTSTLIIYGKFLLSSLMLLAFYFGVLRKKASYRMMRIYLLSLPVTSLIMSGLTLKVYQPKAIVIDAPQTPSKVTSATIGSTPIIDTEAVNSLAINWGAWVFYAISAVSVILMLIATYYIIKMYVLSRKMKAEKSDDGYNIVRSDEVKTPFSFIATIFMPADIEGDKANLILMHEKAHIASRHYIDVWMIEFMTRLLWFNPLMWVTRNQLRNVHEYEADRYVINCGADVFRYQTILLEEVAEDSVIIANGFNHSFIRRRFIEMKRSSIGTLSRLGKASTGLWVLIMFCLFTFTVGEAETIVVPHHANGTDTTASTVKEDINKLLSIDEALSADVKANDELSLNDESKDATFDSDDEKTKDDKTHKKVEYASDGYPYVDDLMILVGAHGGEGVNLVRTANETRVICIGTCDSNDEWFWLGGDQTYIEDVETGTHYKARRSANPLSWNSFHIRNKKGETFALEIIFPPLPQNVKRIKFWHLCSWMHLNNQTLNIKDLEIK